ncbi:MAG: hypothetical protein ACK5GZ_08065 [Cyanobium sp.]
MVIQRGFGLGWVDPQRMGLRPAMGEKLLLTALFSALAGFLLDPEQAPLLLEPLRQGISWAGDLWPALRELDFEPLLAALPEGLAIGLLLLIPVIWLKPT